MVNWRSEKDLIQKERKEKKTTFTTNWYYVTLWDVFNGGDLRRPWSCEYHTGGEVLTVIDRTPTYSILQEMQEDYNEILKCQLLLVNLDVENKNNSQANHCGSCYQNYT